MVSGFKILGLSVEVVGQVQGFGVLGLGLRVVLCHLSSWVSALYSSWDSSVSLKVYKFVAYEPSS